MIFFGSVASKHSQWYKETASNRPLSKTELDHHIIVNQIPGNLQCIVDHTIALRSEGTMDRSGQVKPGLSSHVHLII